MKRFRELSLYPKLILILLVLLAVVFAAAYGGAASRVGYLYHDAIFVPRQSEGVLVYEGRLDGRDSAFIVSVDTVLFNWGDETYGPYTLRYDPTAVPEEEDVAAHMTGIEILDNGKVCFRGGVTDEATDFWLLSEDGNRDFMISYTMSDGIEYDMDGNPIDPMEPSPHEIISLLRGPELTHKGDWISFLVAVFCAAATAVSILFADELFYLSICFRVENAETAEPSDWAIASRSIGWGLMVLVVLWIYLLGLQ